MSDAPIAPLVLMVEDCEEDREAVARALSKTGLKLRLDTCESGDDALEYLYGRGRFSERAGRPQLVILDLNLPGTDGREVLLDIKSNPRLRSIPVIVMTTSEDVRDVETSYQFGANSYLVKPVDIGQLQRSIAALAAFWFETAVLPGEVRP